MKLLKLFGLFGLLFISNQVLAYGSSSSSKSCTKPQLTNFKPVNNSQVAPRSDFAFSASANTNPKSIAVTIKQQAVAITITPANQGYQVTGKLPDHVTGAARINISAETVNGCKANEGWLVNISEN